MTFSTATWIVPLLPLGGFLFNFLFGRGSRRLVPRVALLAVGSALALSLVLAAQVLGDPAPKVDGIPWLSVTNQVFGHFTISVGTLLDPLSAMMLVVVTLVSFLVHLYSLGYMSEDPGLARFFMYLGLFTFSMLGLVVSPNLFQMYIFWELVGLCSYLLIGFYTTKPEANQACKKAFVVNRVGDLGMFLGILFLSYYLGTSDFSAIAAHLGSWPLFGPAWLPLGAVALLLFCGAVGKSAQFPLHVWLPDAMEGPTPVSALIHAATMVAAGVFMVARVYAVFDASLMGSVNAPLVVACVGGFTSLFAATIACTQFDIKRVLAYSTLSQLGYMVMALGAGGLGVTAGAFHLFTHAFFKALLFLGAGSVIHAVHSNDVRAMGGLRRKMPLTGITFLVASLAISGIWPFAGFFSKDMILAALKDAHMTGLYVLAAAVAFLTAFYMFRLYFLTFEGKEPEHGHPHESPWTMTLPLVVLAVLSLGAGFAGLDFGGRSFGSYIRFDRSPTLASDWTRAQGLALAHPKAVGDYRLATALWAAPALPPTAATGLPAPAPATIPPAQESRAFVLDYSVAVPATLLGLAGIFLAFGVYRLKWIDPGRVARALGPVYTTVYNKYYVDEFYRWMMDHVYYVVSGAIAWFDRHVVDGVMNGLALLMQVAGGALRRLQTGRAQAYALAMLGGILILLGALKVFVP
ncbi:MAG TPA: NADH-quinone oxidoreductase subunit L [bacterium]|jgi:NADH-quinone oxidoreductase subunit L|nr:NADH-quinone oxidoreductase subunit L [bacterium]